MSLPPFRAARIPVTPYQQNCSLLWCEDTMRGAVIDPGGPAPQILAAAKHYGVTIEKIFLTHGHLDHASGASALRRELGVPLEGPHADDDFLLAALDENRGRPGFEHAEACQPDRFLDDGESVCFGSVTFEVLHCPGHTPGHVAYFCRDARFAFVGDILFAGSVGRTDFARSDSAALIRSITEKLLPLGDDVTFLPGHGPTSTFGHERTTNPFLNQDAW